MQEIEDDFKVTPAGFSLVRARTQYLEDHPEDRRLVDEAEANALLTEAACLLKVEDVKSFIKAAARRGMSSFDFAMRLEARDEEELKAFQREHLDNARSALLLGPSDDYGPLGYGRLLYRPGL